MEEAVILSSCERWTPTQVRPKPSKPLFFYLVPLLRIKVMWDFLCQKQTLTCLLLVGLFSYASLSKPVR